MRWMVGVWKLRTALNLTTCRPPKAVEWPIHLAPLQGQGSVGVGQWQLRPREATQSQLLCGCV